MRAGVLGEAGLQSALARQARYGGRIGQILVQMELVSEDVVLRALSKQLGIPIADTTRLDVPRHLLHALDADYAKSQGLCPLRLGTKGRALVVAMSDPGDITVVDEVTRKVGMRVEAQLAGARALDAAIAQVYGLSVATESSESILLDNAGSVIDRSQPPMEIERSWSAVPSVPSAPAAPSQSNHPSQIDYGGFEPGAVISSRTQPPAPPRAAIPRAPSLTPIAGDPSAPPSRAPSLTPIAGDPSAPPSRAPSGPRAPATASLADLEQVVDTLTDAQRQQLRAIRVMVDLLVARGVFSREEYLARLNRG